MWFRQLFGFDEGPWEATRRQFRLDGDILHSRANGRQFAAGRFSLPSLAELRAACASLPTGQLRWRHEVIGDVLPLHAAPDNAGALFQVASQFNCLEFCSPERVPEDGVSDYQLDPTQGPACSLAAAAATVARNYCIPVAHGHGQERDRQINTLADLAADLAGAHHGAWSRERVGTFAGEVLSDVDGVEHDEHAPHRVARGEHDLFD